MAKQKKKYRVYGHASVVVITEVYASNEKVALKNAAKQLPCLSAFAGNGGYDKLIGVAGVNSSVCVDEYITYDDVEQI